MPMSHGVNKKAPTVVSPNPSPPQVFTRVVLQVIFNNLLLLKNNAFSK